jgi:abortive infection bacteriophage resistance protein
MTLGHLSRWLHNLRIPRDRQIVADAYGLDEKVLTSFVHHLTIVRNHCAHHGRVWNRKHCH